MEIMNMYKYLFVLLAFGVVSCGTLEIRTEMKSPSEVHEEPTALPTSTIQEVADSGPLLIPGPEISYAHIRLRVTPGQGSGVSAQTIALVNPVDREQMFANHPEYIQLQIIDYPAPTFYKNQPFIYISTIKDYEDIELPWMGERATEAVSGLKKVIIDQPADVGGFDPLPIGILCCEATAISSNAHYFRFQNGIGVRMIASYRNGFSPISNDDLLYEFHGITDDGLYYVFASFPINAPILVSSSSHSNEIPPAGGVPFPEDTSVYSIYLQQVEQQLNTLSESDFDPQIGLLDNLLESLLVQ